jgi:hypothetical protein
MVRHEGHRAVKLDPSTTAEVSVVIKTSVATTLVVNTPGAGRLGTAITRHEAGTS